METNWRAAGDAALSVGDDCVALSAIYINIKYIFVCMSVVNRSLCVSLSCVFSPAVQLKHNTLVAFLRHSSTTAAAAAQTQTEIVTLVSSSSLFFSFCQQSQLFFTN